MKILSAEEIRLWDQYTIKHEPIASIDLMERAAGKCVDWLEENIARCIRLTAFFAEKEIMVVMVLPLPECCANKDYPVTVYILEFGHKGTEDFQTNLARLHQYPEVKISFIQTEKNFHTISPGEIIIDALFGSGLNRQLEGVTAKLVEHINKSDCENNID